MRRCVSMCVCVSAFFSTTSSNYQRRCIDPPHTSPNTTRTNSSQSKKQFKPVASVIFESESSREKVFFVLMKDMPDSRHSHRTRCKPVPPPYTSDASKRKTLIVCSTIHETKTKHRYSRSLTLCFHRRSKTDGVLFKHSSLSVECGV